MLDGGNSSTLMISGEGRVGNARPDRYKNSSIEVGIGIRSAYNPDVYVRPELRPGYPK